MQQCKYAIATSGTLTLELALHQIPSVAVYKPSLLNYIVGKFLFRINLKHYCLPNIICNKTIFPEFMGINISIKKVFLSLKDIIEKKQNDDFLQLRQILGDQDASKNAAKTIQQLM